MTGEGETATSPEPGDGHPGVRPGAAAGASDATGPAATATPGARGGSARGPGTDAVGAGARGRPFWREFPVLIVVALVIALIIKTFVVQAFFIPSGSMQNTLEVRDKVLVNKVAYHFRPIHPGDIIVFDGAGSWDATTVSPTAANPAARLYDATLRPLLRSVAGLFGTAPGQTDYIKRVIGVPGDHVACCNAQGLVTINGVPLHEQGDLYPGDTPGVAPLGESGHFSLIVPAGRLWVLGDHRSISDDSRGHVADPGDGTIPESKVIGRAFLIVWPPSRWRVLRIPGTFQQSGITSKESALAPSALAPSALAPSALAPSALAPSALAPSAGPAAATGPAAAANGRLGTAPPYLPLAVGFAGAIPVTAFRLRRRKSARRAFWRGSWPRSRPSAGARPPGSS
jgi:signal peptidase I